MRTNLEPSVSWGALMTEISSRANLTDRRLLVGSHIRVRRSGYYHHGIYVGRGRVIHYAGLSSGIEKGPITYTTFEEFADKSEVEIVEHKRPLPKDEIISRAKSRLHDSRSRDGHGYNVIWNNCEHFATWCATGNSTSKQVRAFVLGGFAYFLQHCDLIEF
jgi:hypothetical protein